MDTDRGTGRTSRLLSRLPEGSFLVVRHAGVRSHVRHLLYEMQRSHDAVAVVVADDLLNRFRGVSRRTIGIDHDVILEPRAAQALALLETRNEVIYG